ncbi:MULTISPECIES: NifU family protein [unclassified Streptomyces]|uniref:NifU family protein n=1 Tax=unclassified Streptomyces TaxID=2593676 RepID=UPI001BE8A45F|nr:MULTISPECIES: NifU family protein [unclassified Streptomyces]MBT2406089.1 NifU family protein [Streptomyces sp. ISL-21]MBT2457765.1 NifU family protein [Streptomyces sp. ISL-86]MBT2609147.1 NifU family protein [Streptomyces sp. ISL-87]
MSAATDARQAGQRVEEVLDRLAATGEREVCAAAEELVRVLMDFYGAGLARIVERLGADAVSGLLDDELVASLLALHDLHPEDVHTRIARALDTVRDPRRPLELLGFDEAAGTLRLRLPASGGCGCGSTDDTARQAVEDALACFAPEVTAVELEPAAPPPPALLQIGTRPQAPARVS